MHFKYVEYNLYYNYTYFFFIRQYVLENKSGKKQLSAKNAHDSARRISADIALQFPFSAPWKVRALEISGAPKNELNAQIDNGTLRFRADSTTALLYEISR